MLIKNENLQLFACEKARAINNYLDCDVIQDAITKTEEAYTSATLKEALEYLITAIAYRVPNPTGNRYSDWTAKIKEYAAQVE